MLMQNNSHLSPTPFPIDSLKIDQSFIRPITTEKGTQLIASTIIVMAHALNKTIVAERVETEEHVAFL
jgi:sensor c-di-GMP phosphodiesterase-like protein